MRLHHVQVLCPPGGEDAARRFYGEALGLVEVEKPPALAARGGVWFRSGRPDRFGAWDVELHVGVVQEFRPEKKAHPALVVDDLDTVAERLRVYGYDVEWDDLFPGYRRIYTHDGHGNRVELLQPA